VSQKARLRLPPTWCHIKTWLTESKPTEEQSADWAANPSHSVAVADAAAADDSDSIPSTVTIRDPRDIYLFSAQPTSAAGGRSAAFSPFSVYFRMPTRDIGYTDTKTDSEIQRYNNIPTHYTARRVLIDIFSHRPHAYRRIF